MRRLIAVSASVVFLLLAAAPLTAQDASPTPTPPAPAAAAPAATTTATTSVGVSTSGVSATTSTSATATTAAPAAAPPAEPAATTSETTVTRDEGMEAGTYGVRLRDLEQRINELKEQIFRSKARLSLLAETVLQGVVAGAQTTIVHENRMGSSYKLVKVVYSLDGAPIFNKADEEGSLGEREEFEVYNGSIVPGEHTLTVVLEYRGHGYGIFSYLKGYTFTTTDAHTFTAAEGKSTVLRVVGYEKGGPTTPLGDRPAIQFSQRVSDSGAPVGGEGGE
jgi:hypothetical protein